MGSYIRACLRFLARPLYSGVGAVICLHRVVPRGEHARLPANRNLEITPEDLDLLLTHIRKRGYEIIPLDLVPEALQKPPRRKFIAFSFDDGYRDNLALGLPIFRAHNAPFALHVTTGLINRSVLPWWHLFEHLFEHLDQLSYSDGLQEHTLSLRSPEAKNQAFGQLFRWMRGADQAQCDGFVRRLFEGTGLDPVALSNRYLMNWEEVRRLAADSLVTIGAHTVRHLVLSKLSPEELHDELFDAKTTLEAELQRPVHHMAYPFGDAYAVGPREFAAARECGFVTSATTRSANLFPQHRFHLHSLPRISIGGEHPVLTEFDVTESGLRPARQHRFRRVIN